MFYYNCATCQEFFNLNDIYFCDKCAELKCNNCVEIEVVCTFCPVCLFEVPKASVRSERGWYFIFIFNKAVEETAFLVRFALNRH